MTFLLSFLCFSYSLRSSERIEGDEDDSNKGEPWGEEIQKEEEQAALRIQSLYRGGKDREDLQLQDCHLITQKPLYFLHLATST